MDKIGILGERLRVKGVPRLREEQILEKRKGEGTITKGAIHLSTAGIFLTQNPYISSLIEETGVPNHNHREGDRREGDRRKGDRTILANLLTLNPIEVFQLYRKRLPGQESFHPSSPTGYK